MKVLIAEDEATSRLILKTSLEAFGHEVVECKNGNDVLGKLFTGELPQLVFLDWMMPEVDGLEVCAICRELVALMGGEIRVKSTLGVGSTFTFELPLPEAPQNPSTHPGPVLKPRLKVLVVEDDAICAKVELVLLKELDCDVEHVADGRAAYEAAALKRYDLILMDIQVPECDGLQACKNIRANSKAASRHSLIVALTANVFEQYRIACREAGMDGFLSKPLSRVELAGVVAQARNATGLNGFRSRFEA